MGADVSVHKANMAEPVIKFDAIVYKVQTLVDGGVRLTLDMSENSISQMAMLAQTKIDGIVLDVEVRAKAIPK